MLLATLLLTLLAGALTWWMLKRQLSPLGATADAMVALANSTQILKPLQAINPDEIGRLVDGFNRILTLWTQREVALLDSQQNLAITLNSIGDAVMATDAAGRITQMNPVAERLTACSLANALGHPLTEVFCIVNALTRQPVADPVQRVMAEGQVVGLSNHTVLLAHDGQEYQITDNAAPIRNAAGDIAGVVLVFRDVTAKYLAEAALREREQHFRNLYEKTPLPYQSLDIEANILEVNEAWLSMLGYTRDEVIGHSIGDYLTEASVDTLRCAFPNFQSKGQVEGVEYELICKNGTRKLAVVNGKIARDSQGNFQATHCILTDITERKQSEEALRIAATAFESQQGMFVTNAQRVILRVNTAFTDIAGYSAEEAVGQKPSLLQSGRHDRAFYAAMSQALETLGAWAGEIWNRRKNGEIYPEWMNISAVKDNAGQTSHYVAIFSDISLRLSAQVQIDKLAFYDPLTHLPNRRLLLERLEQALHVSTRHARKNGLLFVDLDNFKTLNDTLGHQQGDLLLEQVAQRLRTCIREGDTLARLGSDEFVVMLENLSEDIIDAAIEVDAVGEQILAAFVPDFTLTSVVHHATPSIGTTLFGGTYLEDREQPLKRAELAMFQAKAAGRNTLRFFEARMQAEVSARAELEKDLREAVQKQQFLLYYQPQVVGDGRMTGMEALVRWQHPQRGMVSPAQFIPLAEESDLILSIGQWVLETACAQLAVWARQPDLAHLSIAVNVSARQFKQVNFVGSVLATLARTQANPTRLKLELTESMLVDDVEGIITKMGELKARGVSFSLDDFGTGYSSLAYLKRLPLDQLKIDQGFVRNIVTDPNDAAIARMVVALGESMGLSVIAEGVELQAQVDFLAHQGCHAYQGYLFSKPLPLAALEAFARGR
jgi:diguanylate cyclase (GGDEF)-like protein/PAS domain S-box-containing protein